MNESRNLNGSRIFIATILAAGTLAFCGVAIAYTGEELAKDAKLNIQAARDIALKVRPGKITDEELEKEKAAVACAIPLTSKLAPGPTRWASML